MGERIRKLRKSLGLTLAEFGARIGIGASSLSAIETGKTNPAPSTLREICRVFDVNDQWLREGGDDDDMLNRHEDDEELNIFFKRVINCGTDDFRRRFITALTKLGPEEWKVLNEIAKGMYESGARSEAENKKTETD